MLFALLELKVEAEEARGSVAVAGRSAKESRLLGLVSSWWGRTFRPFYSAGATEESLSLVPAQQNARVFAGSEVGDICFIAVASNQINSFYFYFRTLCFRLKTRL